MWAGRVSEPCQRLPEAAKFLRNPELGGRETKTPKPREAAVRLTSAWIRSAQPAQKCSGCSSARRRRRQLSLRFGLRCGLRARSTVALLECARGRGPPYL